IGEARVAESRELGVELDLDGVTTEGRAQTAVDDPRTLVDDDYGLASADLELLGRPGFEALARARGQDARVGPVAVATLELRELAPTCGPSLALDLEVDAGADRGTKAHERVFTVATNELLPGELDELVGLARR